MQQLTRQNWTIYQLKKREKEAENAQEEGKPKERKNHSKRSRKNSCMHACTHIDTHTPLVWFLVPPSPICPSWCRTCQPPSAHKQKYIRCSCNTKRRGRDKVRHMSGSIAQQTTQKCMLRRRISSTRFHSLPPHHYSRPLSLPLPPIQFNVIVPLWNSLPSTSHASSLSHLLQKGLVPPVPSYQNEQVLQPHAVDRAIMAAPLFQLYYQYGWTGRVNAT